MPEFNLNLERSRRSRNDIQGKSTLLERAIEVILIEIVRCSAVVTVLHGLILRRRPMRREYSPRISVFSLDGVLSCCPWAERGTPDEQNPPKVSLGLHLLDAIPLVRHQLR